MSLSRPNLFLTFVLSLSLSALAQAAPTTNVTPQELNQNAPPAESSRKPFDQDSLVTPELSDRPLNLSVGLKPTRVVREVTWNLSLGLWSGPLKEKGETIQTQVISAGQTLQQPDESALEYGVDLTASGQFGLHLQHKKYCCLGQYFEPYWTFGARGLYKPWEQLAGIVKIDSYSAMAGGGVEDLFNRGRRWRAEALAGLGSQGMNVMILFGYAFDEDSRIF